MATMPGNGTCKVLIGAQEQPVSSRGGRLQRQYSKHSGAGEEDDTTHAGTFSSGGNETFVGLFKCREPSNPSLVSFLPGD